MKTGQGQGLGGGSLLHTSVGSAEKESHWGWAPDILPPRRVRNPPATMRVKQCVHIMFLLHALLSLSWFCLFHCELLEDCELLEGCVPKHSPSPQFLCGTDSAVVLVSDDFMQSYLCSGKGGLWGIGAAALQHPPEQRDAPLTSCWKGQGIGLTCAAVWSRPLWCHD